MSSAARDDIDNLKKYIKDELKAPKVASKYIEGLQATVQELSYSADIVGTNEYVQKMFGVGTRHILYKKIAIIFHKEDDCVYIRRIIASTLIR
ncbi:MAG: type II toxin-antitoxin system RelE/ParE family toxin [Bacteroidales bacterium]|nr:type II toxin-antitoxin system RelE/ParE family toxin [Bacteroidales bacterium]